MACTSLLDPRNSVSVYQGESKTFELRVTKDNPDYPELSEQKKIPVDISLAVIYFTVKRTISDLDVLIRKTSASAVEIDITDGVGGVAEIYVTPSDTATLQTTDYVYDVWVELSGRRNPVVRPSTFRVVPGVTRF